MANCITLSRLMLLFTVVGMVYWAPSAVQLANAPLVLVVIALDGLDGYVARRRGETSVFGSMFDIAADRAVENVLWIVLGHIGLVPIWVAIVFIVRGAIVDTIRHTAVSRDTSAYGMLRSPWSRILVAGRFMRGLYGTVKAVTFAWALLLQPMPMLYPDAWAVWGGTASAITMTLVLASVALCIIRGLPVLAEFIAEHKVVTKSEISLGR